MKLQDLHLFRLCVAFVLTLLLLPNGYALEFSIGKTLRSGQELFNESILLEGEIQAGDAERFRAFLASNSTRVVNPSLNIVLNSAGGSISDAMQIGQAIEEGMFGVWLPPSIQSPVERTQVKCASSCFLIVAAAPSRIVHKNTIGLHRPYFNAKFYESLSSTNAVARHDIVINSVRIWLKNRGVHDDLIEKMMRNSSREIHWLGKDDVESLGQLRPAYEELMIAKCGYDKTLFSRWSDAAVQRLTTAESLKRQLDKQSACTSEVTSEMRRAFISRLK
jgi:hypothetical protein